MNRFLLLVLVVLAVAATSCHSNDTVSLQSSMKNQVHQFDTANYTTIKWIDSVQDFGAVQRGEKVKVVFHVLNTGDKPLYIAQVKPSCGCTLANYTLSPILPGQQGEVTAAYDSNHGLPNQQVHKTISVTCNAKNETQSWLVFTGVVKVKS